MGLILLSQLFPHLVGPLGDHELPELQMAMGMQGCWEGTESSARQRRPSGGWEAVVGP